MVAFSFVVIVITPNICEVRAQRWSRTYRLRGCLRHPRSKVDLPIKSCLPMAPALPIGGSGDFGTSPFFLGQLTDKTPLDRTGPIGVLDAKHNRGEKLF